MNRTEQDILKDFEKLGFEVKENSNYRIKLSINDNYTIIISKWYRTYRAVHMGLTEYQVSAIGMKEHKLLHELFTCWGWLDE